MRRDGLTERQTDMSNLTVTFRNFANAPKKPKIVHNLIFHFITMATRNKLCIDLQVIRSNCYSEQRLYLFMNPPPYSVLKYYESKCTATSLSSSRSLFIFFLHAISSQQTNFAPAVSAPQKKPYFFYFTSPLRLLLFA